MEFRRRSELRHTWSKWLQPTEINIRAGPNGMAKANFTVPLNIQPPD